MRTILETAVGIPNGLRTVFETSASYIPGTVKVFFNGFVHRASDEDGWIELGGRKIELRQAPLAEDVIQFYYLV